MMQEFYHLQELMAHTRRLAVEYREKTGKVLPISHELARYDVGRLFGFLSPSAPLAGVDFIGKGPWKGANIQVKSRVLGKTNTSYRMGSFNFQAPWDTLFLVLFNPEYHPVEVYVALKTVLQESIQATQHTSKHPITVHKFKMLATLVWKEDMEESLWKNYSL